MSHRRSAVTARLSCPQIVLSGLRVTRPGPRRPALSRPMRSPLVILLLLTLLTPGPAAYASPGPSAALRLADAAPAISSSVEPAALEPYLVTDLGLLPGAGRTMATDINNYATIVGWTDQPTDVGSGAFIWRNGTLSDLGGTVGEAYYRPWAVNDRGTVAGWGQAIPTDQPFFAVMWDGGAPRQLYNPDLSTGCTASGLNDAGDIVGTCGSNLRPYLWPGNSETGIDLLLHGCHISTSPDAIVVATDINQTGTVAGLASGNAVTPTYGDVRPIICTPDPANPGEYLAHPIYSEGQGEANAINDSGEAVGFTTDLQGGHIPFRSYGGYAAPLPNGVGLYGFDALDINNAGQIVGEARNNLNEERAVLWTDAGMLDLNTVLPAGWTGGRLWRAVGINDRGDIVAQTSSRSYLLRPPSDVNLKPVLIQVTQAVQSNTNSVMLIAGKRTVVRVFAKATTRPVPEVTALLYGERGGVSLGAALHPTNNPRERLTVVQKPSLEVTDGSFNFELPQSWTTGGPISLRAVINSDRTVAETDYSDNESTLANVAFEPGRTLHVRLIEYRYGSFGSWAALRPVDKLLFKSYMRRMLPVSDIVFHETTWYGTSTTPVDDSDALLDYLTREYSVGEWLHAEEYWYLMAPDQPTYIRGLAWVPGRQALGGAGQPRAGMFDWDIDASYGDWLGTHEFGHNLGRPHVLCRGDEGSPGIYPYPNGAIGGGVVDTGDYSGSKYTGFDVGDPALGIVSRVYNGAWKDIMSYCDYQWISNWTYAAMYQRLMSEPAAGAAAKTAVSGDFLSVFGSVDEATNTADLAFVSRDASVGSLPPIVPGPYHLRLLDAGDQTLADHAFSLRPSEELGHGGIAVVVPYAAGTRRIAITSDLTGGEIASRPVSLNAPVVTVTSHTGGASLPPSGPVTVNWSASDADGDTLLYALLYSPDGGVSWQAVGASETTSLTIDAATIPSSIANGGRFRVRASDGVLTAIADSAPFDVPNRAPVATIAGPASGSLISTESSLNLVGYGQDLEDGSLSGASLAWASDLAGPLGTGSPLQVSGLVSGTHAITLSATDSVGLTGQASITVTVMTTSTLPTAGPALRASPDPLDFTFEPGGASPGAQTLTLANLGAGVVDYAVATDVPWLAVSPITGTVPATVTVTLDSSALLAGTHTGHVVVTSTGALNSPYSVTVRAMSSVPVLELDLNRLSFGAATVGTDGIARTVTLKNNGPELPLAPVALGGSRPGDYPIVADTCSGAGLAPGSACQVTVRYHPSALGASSAYLIIAGASGNPAGDPEWAIPLSGVGIGVPTGLYYMTVLPNPISNYANATGINNRGQVVGTVQGSLPSRISKPVIWEDGAMRNLLEALGGGADAGGSAAAINDAGQVVGLFANPYWVTPGLFLLDGASWTDLGTSLDSPHALSNRGQVAANRRNATRAVLWDNGQLLEPGSLRADELGETVAYGLNDLGTAVGAAQYAPGSSDRMAFVWQNGTTTPLPAQGGDDTGVARAVNDLGQIVGWSAIPAGYRATLWQDGVAHNLGTLQPEAYRQSWAYDINTVGQAVGEAECVGASCELEQFNPYNHAVIYAGGVVTDLNRVVVNPPPKMALEQALAINDLGQIVGNGERLISDAAGNSVNDKFAYLLDPITVASDLAIQAGSTQPAVDPGGVITYTLSVTNRGPDPVRALSIEDTWPTGLLPVSCTAGPGGSCANAYQATIITFAHVAAGQTVTATLSLQVPAGAVDGTRIDNLFRVTGATFDPDAGNNTALVSVPVGVGPELGFKVYLPLVIR